jgi:hypothetical protein
MEYKLYFLNTAGRIDRRVDLRCDSDELAIRSVNAHADGRAMELWCETKVVKTFIAHAQLSAQPSTPPISPH